MLHVPDSLFADNEMSFKSSARIFQGKIGDVLQEKCSSLDDIQKYFESLLGGKFQAGSCPAKRYF